MRTFNTRVLWVAFVAILTLVFVSSAASAEEVIVDDFSNWRHAGPVFIDKSAAIPKDGGATVDVLFLYTTALAEVQSLETIEQRADEALAYMNQALDNSDVTHRYAHCGVQEVEYVETGDMDFDFDEIQHPSNEHLDTLGCDVGVAFIDNPFSPGLGADAAAATTTNPERSTVILQPQAMVYAAPHELGHAVGLCKHNIEEYPNGVLTYNGIGRHGHWDFDPLTMDGAGNGGAFRTIMSYTAQEAIDAGVQTLTVPYFSNPAVDLHGVPTGTEFISECALLLEHRMPFVADYRDKVEQPGVCTPSATNLCLNGGRFKVEVNWRTTSGDTGVGQVVPGASDDSGLFWFFGPNNWEMLIKVIDACGLNDRFWVFFAATTDVEFTLTVTDTETGVVKTYTNPLGQAANAVTDTDAFATCN